MRLLFPYDSFGVFPVAGEVPGISDPQYGFFALCSGINPIHKTKATALRFSKKHNLTHKTIASVHE